VGEEFARRQEEHAKRLKAGEYKRLQVLERLLCVERTATSYYIALILSLLFFISNSSNFMSHT